jgi:hypothetical protein
VLDKEKTFDIRLSVRPLEGAFPMFLPGQYINVSLL